MPGGARLRGRTADANAREHRLDLQAEVLERRGEQQVVLEAVPAAPLGDHLALEVLLLERDRDAPVRVEILERDRRGVGPVDLCQVGESPAPRPIRSR